MNRLFQHMLGTTVNPDHLIYVTRLSHNGHNRTVHESIVISAKV